MEFGFNLAYCQNLLVVQSSTYTKETKISRKKKALKLPNALVKYYNNPPLSTRRLIARRSLSNHEKTKLSLLH